MNRTTKSRYGAMPGRFAAPGRPFLRRVVAVLALAFPSVVFAAELVVLVPLAAGNQVLTKPGPKGGSDAPIVRRATDDGLTKAIEREATRGTTKFMLNLDERAQRVAGIAQPAPSYLVATEEASGTARRGFWLSDAGKLAWRDVPYVELTVTHAELRDGHFEEDFAYEMGHVILRRLLPRLPEGLSRTPPSSLAVTDYPTAFAEGFAIHFQGVARRLTENAALRALDLGLNYEPFVPYRHDNIDRLLRIRGMRDNLFIQEQLPAPLKVGDATSLFDMTHFKNGQQMLSSEGVIATLFYHLLNTENDTDKLRAARYYSLFLSLRKLNAQKLSSSSPVFLDLVRTHARRLPPAKSQWISTVIDLTYGATAGTAVIDGMTELAALGQEAHDKEFAAALERQRANLARLAKRVTADPRRLDDAVGPELWIAIKSGDDTTTINLNTAEKTTLMDVLGFQPLETDLLLADRRANGPFKSVDDFAMRRRASSALREKLSTGHALALELGRYRRP